MSQEIPTDGADPEASDKALPIQRGRGAMVAAAVAGVLALSVMSWQAWSSTPTPRELKRAAPTRSAGVMGQPAGMREIRATALLPPPPEPPPEAAEPSDVSEASKAGATPGELESATAADDASERKQREARRKRRQQRRADEAVTEQQAEAQPVTDVAKP